MLFNFSLLSFATAASLIIGVSANPRGPHLNRHQGIAKRFPGNVQLHKRFDNTRWTFYDVGMGACGKNNVASDFIVALNTAQFGSGYPGPNCFKTIIMTYNGKTTTATIMDECPGCPYGGLDLSRGLFQFFAAESVGVIYAEWSFSSGGDGNAPATTSEVNPTTTWEPVATPTSTWKDTTTWTPVPATTQELVPTTTWKPDPTTTWTPDPTTTWTPDPTTTWSPDPTTTSTTWKPDPTTTSTTWKPDPTTTTPATTEKTSTLQSSSASLPSSAPQAYAAASSSSESATPSAPSATEKNIDNLDEIMVLFGSVIIAAAGAGDGSA